MTIASPNKSPENPESNPSAGGGKRRWPVTAVGLLLMLEAFLLLCIFPTLVIFRLYKLPPEQLSLVFLPGGGIAPFHVEFSGMRSFLLTLHFASLKVVIPPNVTSSAIYGFFSPLLILTGIAFMNLWRRAWMLAVFFQALFLSLALIFYFNLRHPYVYVVMLYASYLVFYLNHHDVKIAFPELRPPARSAMHESAPARLKDS